MILLEELYREVYPGIMARAKKFAKGDYHLSNDWAGEAVMTLIKVYEKFKDSDKTKDDLIKIAGKQVALKLLTCYRNNINNINRFEHILDDEGVHSNDNAFERIEIDIRAEKIKKSIPDVRLQEFFSESYEPSKETMKTVYNRVKICIDRGVYNNRTHPTDEEIGKTVGVSKATSSRFRSRLREMAVENQWV